MSDVSPYGVTQNPNAEFVTANALVGERVSPVIGNSLVGSASMFSTAPYKPPRAKRPVCTAFSERTQQRCNARPVKGTDRCVFHAEGQARHDREETEG